MIPIMVRKVVLPNVRNRMDAFIIGKYQKVVSAPYNNSGSKMIARHFCQSNVHLSLFLNSKINCGVRNKTPTIIGKTKEKITTDE